ncbi:hypothetical protein [Nitratireductor sp. CH_MIT9313-5]|uniref:hypothetical protein n=1 Tax=Nitratireductor sp. CH_MIT9313-5 TaxID=3107764 RepID=UPI00300AD029
MSQFKPISEWIAEGVNPVGYVDKGGALLVHVSISSATYDATMQLQDGSYEDGFALSHPVAPPARKRVSDEELLSRYVCFTGETNGSPAEAEERREYYRTQILQRMKGPTRGEVRPLDLSNLLKHAFLSGVVAARNIPGHEECIGPELWPDYDPTACPAYDRILSMFPEGE